MDLLRLVGGRIAAAGVDPQSHHQSGHPAPRRLGPRGGRGLLIGFALGSGLAGARLALYALAVLLPGVSPAGSSVPLPVFWAEGGPILDSLWIATA